MCNMLKYGETRCTVDQENEQVNMRVGHKYPLKQLFVLIIPSGSRE